MNTEYSLVLLSAFKKLGIEHAVISPGSRSTPLVIAAAELFQTTICVDERGAAFTALGIAKSTSNPVIVISTSGSAPGHWLPAAIEAKTSGVPLIFLSADRPPELHDCCSNQTINQISILGEYVNAFYQLPLPSEHMDFLPNFAARAYDKAVWPKPGPVHLNIPFAEPLTPQQIPFLPEIFPPHLIYDFSASEIIHILSKGKGAIIAGKNKLPTTTIKLIIKISRKYNIPIIADPLSGLRFGRHDISNVMVRYDSYLRQDIIPYADWLLSFGGPLISKAGNSWLSQAKNLIIVDNHGDWPDPNRSATLLCRVDPEVFCKQLLKHYIDNNSSYLHKFNTNETCIRDIPDEGKIISKIISIIPENSALFLGNSMTIRDFDSFSGKIKKKIHIFANRGASGIDGNISSVIGLAKSNQFPLVVAIIGDLSFYHDINSIQGLKGLKVKLITINNSGGGIFYYLPQKSLKNFHEFWQTPLNFDIKTISQAFDIKYSSSLTIRSLPEICEIKIDPVKSLGQHRAYWQFVGS